jgi:hypothetical protein
LHKNKALSILKTKKLLENPATQNFVRNQGTTSLAQKSQKMDTKQTFARPCWKAHFVFAKQSFTRPCCKVKLH